MQPVETISIISENERSSVSLVCLADTDTLAVLKKRRGADLSLLNRINAIQSPYIPHVYEMEQTEDGVLILEEHLCGRTLRERLDCIDSSISNRAENDTTADSDVVSSAYRESSLLTEEELLFILESIGRALRELHALTPAIIFRDLKPENIFLTDDDRVLLIDFDAARSFNDSVEGQSHDTELLGTRSYAAPEQYGFAQTDVRTDIYSFGIVMKELLAKANCSTRTTARAQKILRKATMFAPEDRYHSIDQMLEDILMIRPTLTKKNLPKFILLLVAIYLLGAGSGYGIPKLIGYIETQKLEREFSKNAMAVFDDPDSFGLEGYIFETETGEYSFGGFPDEITPSVLLLPNSRDGVMITEISEYALAGRLSLTAVLIPEGYTTIADYAFNHSESLNIVFIADDVTNFGTGIFNGCPDVTIFCHEGSAAQAYAIENDIPYCITDYYLE